MSNWPRVVVRARGRARGRARSDAAGRPPSPSSSGPATRRTRSASKRSLPAETGVWIVNTVSRRTCRQAPRRASSPAATSSRARSTSRNAEWPSLRCQAAGSMPSARSARTPPTPRTSSWCSRISRPRTYRMWVIGRSASSLSGMSVSSSSSGTRPTWASQTRDVQRRGRAARRRPSAGRPSRPGRALSGSRVRS